MTESINHCWLKLHFWVTQYNASQTCPKTYTIIHLDSVPPIRIVFLSHHWR